MNSFQSVREWAKIRSSHQVMSPRKASPSFQKGKHQSNLLMMKWKVVEEKMR